MEGIGEARHRPTACPMVVVVMLKVIVGWRIEYVSLATVVWLVIVDFVEL